MKKHLYEEYFARQIYWIERAGTIENLVQIGLGDLATVFKAVQVSNHLLVFNVAMTETFIDSNMKQ